MALRLLIAAVLLPLFSVAAQNPLLPGYFADPSIRVIDGRYHIYATTDGYERYGVGSDPLVWISDDLMQWQAERLKGIEMEYFWAPAIYPGKDGRWYLYHQHGVDFQGYVRVGETPSGPFGKRIQLGGFDIEPFEDPRTGKVYLTTSTTELMELESDPASPAYLTKVVATHRLQGQFDDFTEGVYLMHRDSLYYMMWSGGRCWLDTYNVRYAVSENLLGPYVQGGVNPIIATDLEAGISGPGHHSVLQYGSRAFLVYHRQDMLRAPTCEFRFTCIAEILFDSEGWITGTVPIDNIGEYLELSPRLVNVALNKPVAASSVEPGFAAALAVDGRNDTRWMTGPESQWTEEPDGHIYIIDLEEQKDLAGVDVHFEYPEKYHLFRVDYSSDKNEWHELANHIGRAEEAWRVSSIREEFTARYVKLTVLHTEDRLASVWEIEVWENK